MRTRLFLMRRRVLPLVPGGLLMHPESAHAHLVSSGVGPFYDGMAHFLVSPEDLVVVAALAVFAGLSNPTAARWLVRIAPVAWLCGIILGVSVSGLSAHPIVTAGTMLVSGLLLAVQPDVRPMVPAGVGVGIALLHGFLNGQSMVATNTPALAALGIVTALTVVAVCLAAFASTIRVSWQVFAARTLGSWVAAVALLILGWLFRGTGF